MRRTGRLIGTAVFLVAVALPASATATTVAFRTSGVTTFKVPAGVSTVQVKATGAAGGPGFTSLASLVPAAAGGAGGTASGTIAVTPGQTLEVVVGGTNHLGAPFTGGSPNGGGASAVIPCGGSGCSGAPPALVAAGGGGGGGCSTNEFLMCQAAGGNGGAPGRAGTAGSATPSAGGGGPGQPAAASSPGSGGTAGSTGVGGSPGAKGADGAAGSGGAAAPGGGGGGGGIFGGGGGGSGGTESAGMGLNLYAGDGGGGGGSSLAPAGGQTGIASTAATAAVVISWADPAGVNSSITLTASAEVTLGTSSSTVHVAAVGGAGGAGDASAPNQAATGGLGASVSGSLSPAAGQPIGVFVGSDGHPFPNLAGGPYFGLGGAPDGGGGNYGSGGGGGSTRIALCPVAGCGANPTPVLVAAGGGGGGGAGVPTAGFPAIGGSGGNAGAAGGTGGEDGAHDGGGGGGQPTGAGGAAGPASTSPVIGTAGYAGASTIGSTGGGGAGSFTDASLGEGGGGGGGGLIGGGGGGSGGSYPTDGDYAAGGGGGGGKSLAPAGGSVGLAAQGATPEVVLSWATPAESGLPSTGGSSAPKLTAVSQSASRWRAGTKLPQLNPHAAGPGHSRHKPPVGTTFALRVDQRATVSFGFSRLLPGRRGHGHCMRATKPVGRRLRCTLALPAGAFSVHTPAGRNRVVFQGQLTSARHLSAGRYRVKITAVNTVRQRSVAKALTFTIIR